MDADELLGIAGSADLVVEVENFAQLSTYLKNIVSLACVTPIATGRLISIWDTVQSLYVSLGGKHIDHET